MTFPTILLILALVAFLIAAVGFTYKKTDLIAIGLALWSLSELLTRLSTTVELSTIILILAFIAFVAAAVGWRYRKVNMIAVGLVLWMIALLIGPVLHIG